MKNRIKAWLPTPETVRQHRWLRWMGPILNHPRLWHFNRKGIALGMALGVFFGLLIPIAQIPFAATMAVLLRANVPMAMASTLVTNPITFGPVYYGAYHLGEWVLGHEASELPAALNPVQTAPTLLDPSWLDTMMGWFEQITSVGKPLALGLVILACVFGVLIYALVSLLWVLKTRWSRRQRQRLRSNKPGP
ncbi:MAG: hypothetical protein RL297_1422 [Pseudomonadota bacterium]|jgi:uncharacterized protein (DUF2062 family)